MPVTPRVQRVIAYGDNNHIYDWWRVKDLLVVGAEPVLFKPATLSVFIVIQAMQLYKNIWKPIKQTNKKINNTVTEQRSIFKHIVTSQQKKMMASYVSANHGYVTFLHFIHVISIFLKWRSSDCIYMSWTSYQEVERLVGETATKLQITATYCLRPTNKTSCFKLRQTKTKTGCF